MVDTIDPRMAGREKAKTRKTIRSVLRRSSSHCRIRTRLIVERWISFRKRRVLNSTVFSFRRFSRWRRMGIAAENRPRRKIGLRNVMYVKYASLVSIGLITKKLPQNRSQMQILDFPSQKRYVFANSFHRNTSQLNEISLGARSVTSAHTIFPPLVHPCMFHCRSASHGTNPDLFCQPFSNRCDPAPGR